MRWQAWLARDHWQTHLPAVDRAHLVLQLCTHAVEGAQLVCPAGGGGSELQGEQHAAHARVWSWLGMDVGTQRLPAQERRPLQAVPELRTRRLLRWSWPSTEDAAAAKAWPGA